MKAAIFSLNTNTK